MTRRAHFTRARPERKKAYVRTKDLASPAKCVRVRSHACTHARVRARGCIGGNPQNGRDRQTDGRTGEKETAGGREFSSLGSLPKDLLPQKYLITTLPVV